MTNTQHAQPMLGAGAVLLEKVRAQCVAEQCRGMGLAVGDVIQGRESYQGHWNDARLTLLFIGAEVAVFNEETRSDREPQWTDCEETADWDLHCRDWRMVNAQNVPPIARTPSAPNLQPRKGARDE